MDKVKKYEQILCDVLSAYGAIKKHAMPDVKWQQIIDYERRHFQLLSVGWYKGTHVYTIAFHFDIIGEKIWIQQNNTDVLIGDELVERGVAKNDIVLGWINEAYRSHSGFAVN